jgi:acyl-CoA thioester hydrolase
MVTHTHQFRIRYAETDQMGTFYNARALEWFEVGRSELARAIGLPYTEWEARGAFLPLSEAYVKYLGRARYDDLLEMTIVAQLQGRVRLRFELRLSSTRGATHRSCSGYTIHPVVNADMRPIRVPEWIIESLKESGR